MLTRLCSLYHLAHHALSPPPSTLSPDPRLLYLKGHLLQPMSSVVCDRGTQLKRPHRVVVYKCAFRGGLNKKYLEPLEHRSDPALLLPTGPSHGFFRLR